MEWKNTCCREHGIFDKAFFYWRRRLREETYFSTLESSSLPAVKTASVPAAVEFHPARCVECILLYWASILADDEIVKVR